MKPDSFILSALQTLPDHTITGKKRLQKLAMLLQVAGLEVDADFSLHHYGPYSFELAEAADELYWTGVISEQSEQRGVFGTFQTVYRLDDCDEAPKELPNPFKNKLLQLNEFSTIALEMASTIALFENEGLSRNAATEKASTLKKAKATPAIMEKAGKILEIIK